MCVPGGTRVQRGLTSAAKAQVYVKVARTRCSVRGAGELLVAKSSNESSLNVASGFLYKCGAYEKHSSQMTYEEQSTITIYPVGKSGVEYLHYIWSSVDACDKSGLYAMATAVLTVTGTAPPLGSSKPTAPADAC